MLDPKSIKRLEEIRSRLDTLNQSLETALKTARKSAHERKEQKAVTPQETVNPSLIRQIRRIGRL